MDPLLLQTLNRIENKVDGLDTKVAGVDTKVNGVDRKLDTHLNDHKVAQAQTFYPKRLAVFVATVVFTAATTGLIGRSL